MPGGPTDASHAVQLRKRSFELQLKNTFRLSRGATDSRTNLFVELQHDGLVGLGEAAPLARYQQDWRSASAAVDEMAAQLGNLNAYREAVPRVAVAGQPAAQAALDMAVWDLAGKRLGAPVWRLLGLDLDLLPPTSFTIGIEEDTEELVRRVEEAAGFDVLKVKLGGDNDRRALETIRSLTDVPLRIDANEGWTIEEAGANLEWLSELGVELIEQPLPAADLEGHRQLKAVSPIPLFADESIATAADIPRIAASFDGINIKLMKCGGLGEALKMIATSRAHGLQVMLGCMVESSIAISAAAHISPLVDFADLDGALLVANDPYVGAGLVEGRIHPPDTPGLGVRIRE